jgi:hypothetical protein
MLMPADHFAAIFLLGTNRLTLLARTNTVPS